MKSNYYKHTVVDSLTEPINKGMRLTAFPHRALLEGTDYRMKIMSKMVGKMICERVNLGKN